MARESFLDALRELARCYQAFESYSASHVRTLGLTPPQFDIVATLGNTPGMSFRELGEKTLITKGTLTGVVDRLASRRLVQRVPSADDGRSMIVRLTPSGERLFERAFTAHLDHLRLALGGLSERQLRQAEETLRDLREAFAAARTRAGKPAPRQDGRKKAAR